MFLFIVGGRQPTQKTAKLQTTSKKVYRGVAEDKLYLHRRVISGRPGKTISWEDTRNYLLVAASLPKSFYIVG